MYNRVILNIVPGFPGSLTCKESTFKVGDPGSIPGSRRSPNRLPTPVFLGFPGGSDGKESALNNGTPGFDPWVGKIPGGGHGNSLQYSCLESPHGWRSLAGYSPWGHKELDRMERLSTAQHNYSHMLSLRSPEVTHLITRSLYTFTNIHTCSLLPSP